MATIPHPGYSTNLSPERKQDPVQDFDERPYELQDRDWRTALRPDHRAHGHHPTFPVAESRDEKLAAIDEFCYRLSEIVDPDYGDWMRKANVYLWDLIDTLHTSDPELHRIFDVLEQHIQYQPEWNIETTMVQVLDMAERMRERVRWLEAKPI